MFTNIQEIKQYTNVSNRLDFELLKTYIEEALRVKVYPYIPKSTAETLSGDELKLLKKAVANYAVAYASTVQTYRGQVKKDYDVNSFASGAKDWYLGRILVPIEKIKEKLSQGIDSNVHAYYSGVVFAHELQNNFSRLSATCWSNIDRQSMTQGVYDAMLDVQKDKIRSDDDEYIVKGSEMLLNLCK